MTQTNTLPARTNDNGGSREIQLAQPETLKSLFDMPKVKASIAAALPKHLNADRLIKVVLVAVSRTPMLQKCTAQSILQCVMTGAQLGLDCSGVLGSAYMVPYWNNKTGQHEAVFIPGYRGLIDLARRSGQIASVEAHVVYEDDAFDLEFGLESVLKHRPNFQVEPADDKIIAAYMVTKLIDGSKQVEFMTRPEIDRIRKRSKAGNNGPWVTDFSEMCRKTVVRRGVKYLPMSVELADALTVDDASNAKLASIMDMQPVGSENSTLAEPSSRTAALNDRLKRPSPSKPADREPSASDTHDANASDSDATDAQAPPVSEEQEVSGGGTEGDHMRAIDGTICATWRSFYDWTCGLAQEQGITEAIVNKMIEKWLLVIGKKGKPEKTTVEERLLAFKMVVKGRGEFAQFATQ